MYTAYERDDVVIICESKFVLCKIWYKVITLLGSIGYGRNALFTSAYPHRNANFCSHMIDRE